MSLENAKAFLNKVNDDAEFYDKLAALSGNSQAAVELGASMGFVFTTEELIAATDEVFGDLSDDELASAAGGLGGMRPPIRFD